MLKCTSAYVNNMGDDVLSLKKQLLEKDAEIAALKKKLEQMQKVFTRNHVSSTASYSCMPSVSLQILSFTGHYSFFSFFYLYQDNSLRLDLQYQVSHLAPLQCTSLTNDDIMRYSRQLLLPELGVKGEKRLMK